MGKSLLNKEIYVISTIIIMLIALMSITSGSLWGDELCRVVDPISGALYATMKTAMGYAQPGYMLYMLIWSHITGSSEFILRCSNIPFAVLSMIYVYKIVDSKGWSIWWSILFFCHPMFIYYMDEATPYIIVYALALAFTYYVFCSDRFNSIENIILINCIYLTGVFIHFMFGFIIVLYFFKCITEATKDRHILKIHIKVMEYFLIPYAILLFLYLKYLGGTHTGFGIKSVLYIVYSFLGMQGAGLSRNDLRAGNFNSINIVQIIFLFAFAVVLIAIFVSGFKQIKLFFTESKEPLLAILTYMIVIMLVSAVVKLGLWERHCMPVFPLFMICAIGFFRRFIVKAAYCKYLSIIYLILIISSGINLRCNYYYSCDDYKGVYGEVRRILTEDNTLTIFDTQGDNGYYTYADLTANPSKQIIYITDMSDDEIIKCFLSDDHSLLVLFEKNCSKQLYNYFDGKNAYNVNDKYNSFKLITKGNM